MDIVCNALCKNSFQQYSPKEILVTNSNSWKGHVTPVKHFYIHNTVEFSKLEYSWPSDIEEPGSKARNYGNPAKSVFHKNNICCSGTAV